eukprot:m.141542 g.141542  ORF g.141542 m.141542 type:complete len:116 (+) comp52602_c0_seq6:28-375(+)
MFDAVDVSRLVDAVVDNELADCKRIVHAWGADIITADFGGASPLHIAARWGRDEALDSFLSHRINCNTLTRVSVVLSCSTFDHNGTDSTDARSPVGTSRLCEAATCIWCRQCLPR